MKTYLRHQVAPEDLDQAGKIEARRYEAQIACRATRNGRILNGKPHDSLSTLGAAAAAGASAGRITAQKQSVQTADSSTGTAHMRAMTQRYLATWKEPEQKTQPGQRRHDATSAWPCCSIAEHWGRHGMARFRLDCYPKRGRAKLAWPSSLSSDSAWLQSPATASTSREVRIIARCSTTPTRR